MIRRACSALLLACFAITANAGPLYKWTEADGSITFSPDKPPAGVDFQVIDSVAAITAADTRVEPVLAAGSADAEKLPNLWATDVSAAKKLSDSSTQPAAQAENGTVSWSEIKPQRTTPVQTTRLTRMPSITSNSQNRCEDLRKRVVSLERRLQAELTPEDMDNTVLHMSRYQRSYDKFCVQ